MNATALNSHLSTRGLTLCLGLNPHINIPLLLRILNIKTQINPTENKIIFLFNNFEKTVLEEIFVNGAKWELVKNAKSDSLRSSVAILPLEVLNALIDDSSNEEKKLNIDDWPINNVWLFDIFPYQTQVGTMILNKIKEWCAKKGFGLSVGLVSGYNQYGSTDISSEDDAIKKEKEYLEREGIKTMVVNKSLSKDQSFELQSLCEDKLKKALNKLSADRSSTLTFIDDSTKDFILYAIMNKVGNGVEQTVRTVKDTLVMLEGLFPIVKYLDEGFYKEYERAIRPYFESKKDSDVHKISGKCADSLMHAIKYWINRK